MNTRSPQGGEVLNANVSAATNGTYYISPSGNDTADGISREHAWATFARALPELRPGDTLVLLDGEYHAGNSGLLHAGRAMGAHDGEAGAPITIRALNERRAWIQGGGARAVFLNGLSWWKFDGLRISSDDNPDPDVAVEAWSGMTGGQPLQLGGCSDIVLRRLLVHNNNRYHNAACIHIRLSQRVLVEETEFYYFHRNGISAFRSNDITYRRCYGNSRGHGDLPDGRPSHPISRDGGDRTFLAYFGSRLLVENCVSEYRNEGFGFISGRETAEGKPSGDTARFLGCISLNDHVAGGISSRALIESSTPLRNVLFRNFLMVNPKRRTFMASSMRDLTMENVTIWDGFGIAASFSANEEVIGDIPMHVRLRNWLVVGQDGERVIRSGSPLIELDLSHINSWNSPELGVNARHATRLEPTGMGLGTGEQIAFVPEGSSMKGAGEGGGDIGANILYRYVDSELTDEPLWDPETGAFPHGAVIEGINDVPGASLYDLHTRLNVNSNGSRLPYAR